VQHIAIAVWTTLAISSTGLIVVSMYQAKYPQVAIGGLVLVVSLFGLDDNKYVD